MEILFFCPSWGFEDVNIITFLDRVKKANYDGVEMHIPHNENLQKQLLELLEERGLKLIVQQHLDLTYVDFKSYKNAFEYHLRLNSIPSAVSLNLHTGRDYFTFEQNMELLKLTDKVAIDYNIMITHELHRGHFNFCGRNTMAYLKAMPNLKFTADFSHWCCVSESLLEGQEDWVEAICKNSFHFHARIGYSQSPQVPDPRDSRWEREMQAHLVWWDKIVDYRRQDGCSSLYITTEFGPFPYMTYYPNKDKPLANQWEINNYMRTLLKRRYTTYS